MIARRAACASISPRPACAACWPSTSRLPPPARWSSSTPSSLCRPSSASTSRATALALAPSAAARWSRRSRCRACSKRLPDRTAMLGGRRAARCRARLLAAALPSYALAAAALVRARPRLFDGADAVGPAAAALVHPGDRPALFAAQFALSHACWLITYPLAGWAGATLGLPMTAVLLAASAAIAIIIALAVWPADDPEVIEHSHADAKRPSASRRRGARPSPRARLRHRRHASGMASLELTKLVG